MASASLTVRSGAGRSRVVLSGDWTLANLPMPLPDLEAKLREQYASGATWDLGEISRLDSVGAWVLWRVWDRRWPDEVVVSDVLRAVVDRSVAMPSGEVQEQHIERFTWIVALGRLVFSGAKNLVDVVTLFGQLVLDVLYLLSHPQDIPWREFSANLFRSGTQALPVTALVGFLIGIVLSFLSALQLKTFGADIYIVNLLGIAIIRELGPVIVAVLIAGRSGSAMTAQIGVMRVTQEIDALATMGISRSLRLVLPKVAALSIAVPLLVVWCSAAGIVGGMVSANLEMGLAYGFFLEALPRVVPLANLWIGIGKGFVFGMLIALIACHFGLKVRPNTESLAARTTNSVVTAITLVIIADAVIAILTRGVGIPGVG